MTALVHSSDDEADAGYCISTAGSRSPVLHHHCAASATEGKFDQNAVKDYQLMYSVTTRQRETAACEQQAARTEWRSRRKQWFTCLLRQLVDGYWGRSARVE
jgi:hypothetical protein